jgi:hypothetical protein
LYVQLTVAEQILYSGATEKERGQLKGKWTSMTPPPKKKFNVVVVPASLITARNITEGPEVISKLTKFHLLLANLKVAPEAYSSALLTYLYIYK